MKGFAGADFSHGKQLPGSSLSGRVKQLVLKSRLRYNLLGINRSHP